MTPEDETHLRTWLKAQRSVLDNDEAYRRRLRFPALRWRVADLLANHAARTADQVHPQQHEPKWRGRL